MRHLNHPNVVRIFDYFETKNHHIIAMENAGGGDLLSYVRRRTKLPEPIAKFVFKQIISGLEHMHSANILHRDVKLDNILVDFSNTVKVNK